MESERVPTGYLSGMFEFNDKARGRGHQFRLVVKQSRTKLRQSFFSRRAVGHWNKLPTEIVSVTSLRSFKASLDSFFIKKGIAFHYKGVSTNRWGKCSHVRAPVAPSCTPFLCLYVFYVYSQITGFGSPILKSMRQPPPPAMHFV